MCDDELTTDSREEVGAKSIVAASPIQRFIDGVVERSAKMIRQQLYEKWWAAPKDGE